MAHRYIKHSEVIKIITASMSLYTVCLKDTKQKKKNSKICTFMCIHTYLYIYVYMTWLKFRIWEWFTSEVKYKHLSHYWRNRDSVRQWLDSKIGDQISRNTFYFPKWTDLQWTGRKLAWILLKWLVTSVFIVPQF